MSTVPELPKVGIENNPHLTDKVKESLKRIPKSEVEKEVEAKILTEFILKHF